MQISCTYPMLICLSFAVQSAENGQICIGNIWRYVAKQTVGGLSTGAGRSPSIAESAEAKDSDQEQTVEEGGGMETDGGTQVKTMIE